MHGAADHAVPGRGRPARRPRRRHRPRPQGRRGHPDELKSAVGDSTLQLLLAEPGEVPAAVDVVRRVLGSEPVLSPEQGRLNVALDQADLAADVLIALRTAGVSITSVSVAKPSLDEVFLALTGHGTGGDGESGTEESR
ncbi:DUF4162 domain-containing protein [Nonomuraea thailandensis]